MNEIKKEAWRKAIRQFNGGEFFECHETLEECWKTETNHQHRILLQSVIHFAVAYYHLRNGNKIGYGRQKEKGLQKISSVGLEPFEKILNVSLKNLIETVRNEHSIPPKISSTGSEASR